MTHISSEVADDVINNFRGVNGIFDSWDGGFCGGRGRLANEKRGL
jgi:hypothetical protein